MLVELNRVHSDWIEGDHKEWAFDYVACTDVADEVFPELIGREWAAFEITDEPHEGSREFTRIGLRVYEGDRLVHSGYIYQGLRKLLPEGEPRYISLQE